MKRRYFGIRRGRWDRKRRVAKWLINILLVLVLLFVLFAYLLPHVFSSKLAIVYSASMGDGMPVGSLAVMTRVAPADIKVGDIIAFHPPLEPGATVSHRVVEVINGDSLSFVTKGDANEEPDNFLVSEENVLAKVAFAIPTVGFALDFVARHVSSPLGFGLLVVAPAAIVIGSAVRELFFISPGQKRLEKAKKRRERLEKRRPKERKGAKAHAIR